MFAALGAGLAVLGHRTWPSFRRQTLPFKCFLVSCFSIFGLVTYAESALQRLEQEERLREGEIRKQARLELSRQGLVPTETAIAQWKEARMREMARTATSEETTSQQ
ncbi:uncharacterized protein PHACADRAFT_250305 [Phanerochaete carnosa HHB-10118-sp]|uniref:HIG1 domain-containing protein n=1 Tax=Phanerochaete carnosa (strain HHB-10118-sp) TaxID=650164 RepID=K5W6U6_PHACS|nr:uncharacterized protein PHACADRAFT_250305 [Phanerochaete carnosa HHB-10118-sp]EKM59663.1 hypothetical protein PHACADRAFT_250305 [Phanerochaete carnosa HHB-10118-sp]